MLKQHRVSSAVRWLFFACALSGIALLLWHAFFRTEQVIETAPVERGRIEQAVTAPGTLQPHRYVDVGAQVSGQIRRIAVSAGDVVKQGDLLVEIDPAIQQATVSADRAALASLQAQLLEQEASRDLLRQKADRQKMLVERDAVSRESFQTAAADLRMVQARIASLKAQIDGARSTLSGNEALLGYTRIFAPMDGTVISLEAREGQTLNATYQTPNLLRLADLSQMTVWTQVSEADMGKVKAGMPVYFTTLGLLDVAGKPRRWNGTVRQILPAPPSAGSGEGNAPASNSKVVNYTALFDVANDDAALLPQMSARVFFVAVEADDVLLAPLVVLKPTGEADGYTAQVMEGEQITQRSVRIGVRDRLNAAVLEGLNEGDLLVTGITEQRGSRRLRW